MWQKAEASMHNGGCVELEEQWAMVPTSAEHPDGSTRFIAMRNSKDPGGPQLHYTPAELAAFIDGCRNGEFGHLVTPAGR